MTQVDGVYYRLHVYLWLKRGLILPPLDDLSSWPLDPTDRGLLQFVCSLLASTCALKAQRGNCGRVAPAAAAPVSYDGVPTELSTFASPHPASPPSARSTRCISWSVTWSDVVGHHLQNGVVWVCAERAAVLRGAVLLRWEQLPGAARRVLPESALRSRRPRSPRWAAAAAAFVSAAASGFSPCRRRATSMFADFCCELRAAGRKPYFACLDERVWRRRGPRLSAARLTFGSRHSGCLLSFNLASGRLSTLQTLC